MNSKYILLIMILALVSCQKAKNASDDSVNEPVSVHSPAAAQEESENLSPPESEKPKDTIPYAMSLCKTKDGEKVFGYVSDKAKFNHKFETQPVKAMRFDSKTKSWVEVNPKSVLCYDPSEGTT